MKILFVSAVLPYPLYSGGQIRIYNLLKTLGKKHEITLFSFIRDKSELKFRKNLAFCRKVEAVFRGQAWQPKYVAASVLGKYPLLLSTYNNMEMREKLTRELYTGDYDLVHIEPGYVWPALPSLQLPLVVSEHNIESTIYEDYVRHFPVPPFRPFLYADVIKLKYWEREIWRRASGIVMVSESDKEIIGQKINDCKLTVVPNGVDPKVFLYRSKARVSLSPVFLFVGNFSWLQNRDALGYLLRQLWPEIKVRFPKATLNVVGRQMPGSLKNLADKNGVTVLENVSDINSEYRKADIMLAPIRIGGGTKFKILEAMAVGLPVITTLKGIEGLNVVGGKEVTVADGPEEMLKSVQLIIGDDNYRNTLISDARKKIETDYAWENISLKLDKFWQTIYEQNH